MSVTYSIKGIQDINPMLLILKQKVNEKEKIDNEFEKQVQQIKANQDNQTKALTDEIETITRVLKDYALAHVDEFRNGDKKSMKFTHGEISTKEKESVKYPKDEVLIGNIKLHFPKLISTFLKTEEVPIKDAIKFRAEQDASMCSLLGIKISKEISVTVKTK